MHFCLFIIAASQYRPKIFMLLQCFKFTLSHSQICATSLSAAGLCDHISFLSNLPAVWLRQLLLPSPRILPPLLVMYFPEWWNCWQSQLPGHSYTVWNKIIIMIFIQLLYKSQSVHELNYSNNTVHAIWISCSEIMEMISIIRSSYSIAKSVCSDFCCP
jgi:hypothetical protein